MSDDAVHVVDYHDGDCDHDGDVGALSVGHLLLTLKAEKVDGNGDGDGDGDQHPDHRLHRYRESVILADKTSRLYHKSEPAVATKGVLHHGVDGVTSHHLHPLHLHVHPLQQGLSNSSSRWRWSKFGSCECLWWWCYCGLDRGDDVMFLMFITSVSSRSK